MGSSPYITRAYHNYANELVIITSSFERFVLQVYEHDQLGVNTQIVLKRVSNMSKQKGGFQVIFKAMDEKELFWTC